MNIDWLRAGRDSLIHRGPDDSGEWWSSDRRVGLAHRRLSILDLSPLGRQPMRDEQRGLTLVFNGEIYNHQELRAELRASGYVFRSTSDTEVLLAAYAEWEEACVQRLNGMFAFAVYDAQRQSLLLARDRAGEKPLFYRLADGALKFGSELKSLLTDSEAPRRIDMSALDCYLAMGFIPGSRCILDSYRKLPPAHALKFDLATGESREWRYWVLPEHQPDAVGSEEDLLQRLEDLLEDSVGRQMEADVPVGVLLSGGVDSSLITALAVRRSNRVRTFCIGFPGHERFDETQHAALIAKHFKTEHIELKAEPASASIIPKLSEQFDEPMVDSSMIPTFLVSHLVRQHCKVALGGDGGDELFGGYAHYSRLLWMEERLAMLPSPIRSLASWTAERWLPVGFKGRNYLQALRADLKRPGVPLLASYFDSSVRRKLMRNHVGYRVVAEQIREEGASNGADLLQRATRSDFSNYLAEDILVKVDRVSMLNSLEVRAPFLDHRLIEFAFREVPSRLKTTRQEKKILLKRLAGRLLPQEFDTRRKQGFSIPLAEWLKRGPFRDLFWDTLTTSDSVFDRRVVRSLMAGQDRGYSNGERLFALVQFELWRRSYGATI